MWWNNNNYQILWGSNHHNLWVPFVSLVQFFAFLQIKMPWWKGRESEIKNCGILQNNQQENRFLGRGSSKTWYHFLEEKVAAKITMMMAHIGETNPLLFHEQKRHGWARSLKRPQLQKIKLRNIARAVTSPSLPLCSPLMKHFDL